MFLSSLLKKLSRKKPIRYKPKYSRKKASKTKKSTVVYGKADKKLLILTYIVSIGMFLAISGTALVIAVFVYFSRDLPSPNRLLERSEELSTKLYDKNNKPIFEVYGEKNRSLVKLSDVSLYLQHATLAVEDSSFYEHEGFDIIGMIRAVKNTITGKGLQGGSTLTQQVVKNVLLTQERTLTRKIKELILSLQLENKYTKDEILQMYLNETPYGGQNYGVLAASKAYFNKEPSELTIAEAAYIAGLPQSPSRYSIYGSNPQLGLDRKDDVLYLMYTKGWVQSDGNRYFLSEEEYNQAIKEELNFKQGVVHFEAPHFVFYVKDVLIDMFGEELVEQGGLQVKTTLDLDLQSKAEEIVEEQVEASKSYNLYNGALVAIEPKTGGVLAMVGSKNYFADPLPEGCVSGAIENGCKFDPKVNVTTSLRQPGSSIKPITYATMLEQGYTASYTFLDVQTKFQGSAPDKPYVPVNYNGTYIGPVFLRRALANSLNIPAVKALKIVGIDNMIDQAEKMGIKTLTDRDRYGLALTLGGGETKLVEMANAFSVFANNGKFVEVNPIIEVKNAKGEVIYTRNIKEKQVLKPETAFLISDILSDDGARSLVFGLNSALNIPGYQVAVKTGTTDDLRDNYAIGYTPDITVGVWVGNSNNEKMSQVSSGITGATPIWNKFMVAYLNGKENKKFEPPKTMKKIKVDKLTGMAPFKDYDTRDEWFIEGTEPTAPSDWYVTLEICEVDEMLASDECRKAGKTKVKTFIDIKAELPEWQVYVDQWVGEKYLGDSTYFPPSVQSSLKFDDDGDAKGNDPVLNFRHLKDGDSVPLEFRLTVEVSSEKDIKKVKIYVDGDKVTEDKSKPWGYNFSFKLEDVGEHEFEAVAEDEKGRKGSKKIRLKVNPY